MVITTPHALRGEDLYLVLRGTSAGGLIVPRVVAEEFNQITALETHLLDLIQQRWRLQ